MDGREHYGYILFSAIAPLLGVVAAIVLLWNRLVGWPDMIIFAVMYVIAGLGVSTGYHRLLAHRSFTTTRPLKIFFAVSGAMAGQGPPIIWVAHHRRHHRVADKPGDPHSPYQDDDPNVGGILKGLWHAHMGWLFNRELSSDPIRYCPDLVRDRDLRIISRNFLWIVAAGIVLPGLAGLAITQSWFGFFTGALWGGFVRFFASNHITYAVNSIGHYFGRRRFDTPDESRNVAWLSLLSFGESWHNNHHAFPRSARHGFRWWEIDISASVIRMLEAMRLADNVVRIERGREERRAEGLRKVGGGRKAPSAPPIPLAERRRSVSVGVADVE